MRKSEKDELVQQLNRLIDAGLVKRIALDQKQWEGWQELCAEIPGLYDAKTNVYRGVQLYRM
jgi:hypothetical protein